MDSFGSELSPVAGSCEDKLCSGDTKITYIVIYRVTKLHRVYTKIQEFC
jgi:hypothetical protein